MKLGAQFFSIRDKTTTPEGVRESFAKMKEIGYSVVQISGTCEMEAELLRDYSQEYALPITCTHSAYPKIIENVDKLIADHKIFGCDVIGLGSMPDQYRGSLEGVRAFMKEMTEPVKKIRDAGLRFAYHNHAFEFEKAEDGRQIYDILIEEAPDFDFIFDTYWVKYGNNDSLKYIKMLGGSRMTNIHFKDMLTEPQGPICPCGNGTIDFDPIVKLCREVNIPYALIEQDNAPDGGDSYGQMKISYDNMKKYFIKGD